MEIKKGIILVSGGMDSTTLMYLFVHQKVEFIPLFIDYGQHCLSVIPDSYRDKIEVINVSSIYKHSKSRFIIPANLWEDNIKAEDLYIPYRNVLLLTIAASYAQTIGES